VGIDIIGFGALNMDQIYGVARILTDGEAAVTEFRLAPGGSAANTIYGLAKLGVSTAFLGAVGDDEEGRMLLEDFRYVGVDTEQIRVKEAKTGTTLCLTDERGHRALYVLPGANSLLGSTDIDLDYISQSQILHLSSFANEAQLDIQKQLTGKIPPSIKVSFAPGSIYAAKGLEVLTPIIQRAHILFLNRKEVEELTGEGFQNGAKRCLDEGCQIVAITLGKGITKGTTTATCYLLDGQGEYMIEGEKGYVRGDTVGAGDAFATGFLYGLTQGKNTKECGTLGNIVANLSTAEIGARDGLPTLQVLRQMYQQL